MKKFLPLLFVALFSGIQSASNSQVQIMLNGLDFEPVKASEYTVPEGSVLIITHIKGTCWGFGNATGEGQYEPSDYFESTTNIPVPNGMTVSCNDPGNGAKFAGYLFDAPNGVIGVASEVNEVHFDEENTGFSIYPNPATNEVSVFADVQGNWNVTVYDMMGSVVIQAGANAPVKTIDTSSMSAGTYIVSAKTNGNHVGSSRLIIE